MAKDFAFVLLINIVFIFNSRGLIDGPGPTLVNFLFSIVFLTIWFGYGYYRGKQKGFAYLVISSVFLITGILLLLFINLVIGTPLMILAIYFMAPIVGLTYSSPQNIVLFAALPLVLTVAGFGLGLKEYKKVENSDID